MRRVTVWVAPLDVCQATQAVLLPGLAPAERARAERYRGPDDIRRFAVARGWLRRILAAELGVPASEVALIEGPGKPRLAEGAGPCFNLSRAGELAVIAVADFEVGIDVEHRSRGTAALDAVPVACTPAEAAALDRLPAGARADAFLELWTAKEAWLKGRGVGLALAPDSFEAGDAGAAGWCIRALVPAPGYIGAVAGEVPDFAVELRPASLKKT